MARGKRAKPSGKARGIPSSKNQTKKVTFGKTGRTGSPPSDDENSTFTLHDAARNSEHPRSFWSSSTVSLRHQSMNFVRGIETPQSDDVPEQPSSEAEILVNLAIPQHIQSPDSRPNPDSESQTSVIESCQNDKLTGEVDVLSNVHQTEKRSPRNPRSTSVSSDEVVFTGRNNLGVATVGKMALEDNKSHPAAASESLPPGLRMQDYKQGRLRATNTMSYHSQSDSHGLGEYAALDRMDLHKDAFHSNASNTRRGQRMNRVSPNNDDLQAVLDDYVANMRENGQMEGMSESKDVDISFEAGNNDWASSDIEDFDDMSTSKEVLDSVQQILSKRYRPGGLQYLVVWEHQQVDDARWIPMSSLTMPGAADLIEAFEVRERGVVEYRQHESESDESEIELRWTSDSPSDLEADKDEEFEDEKDLIERRMARMTDEHIARLFQKQESLGFNSKELQIFDGAEDFGDSGDSLYDRSLALSRKKRDQKRRKRALFDMDDEMVLDGEDYSDFDVMDHERPSVSKGKSPYSDPFELGLSDSGLAQNLRDAWATDRKKKRLQKQEREKLRAQGLLGKKNKFKPDLKAKYNDGMNLTQIEEELESFLFNRQQDNLSLPPMAKQERKIIHDIANAFGLKSKSQGSNKKRFTVLWKTSRTIEFDHATFERLLTQLNRRFLPRMDQKGRGAASVLRRTAATGKRPSNFGYRDGEVVGAAAPELGAENRGRAMLEKMGWSTGTALGALNNQGILTPIEHVVKNSRAGLG